MSKFLFAYVWQSMDRQCIYTHERIMEMEEMLVCPMCGKEATVENVPHRGWIVKCSNFRCVEQRYGSPTKEDALENWNAIKNTK